MERFGQKIAAVLTDLLETPISLEDLELPPDSKMGDFAFPCFKLAKAHRKAPAQVAADLCVQLKEKAALQGWVEVTTAGPYLNLRVNSEIALGALLGDLLNSKKPYGSLPENSRGSWVLEYSSPNVAKPLNIYHLRPTALGACLDRVGRMRGYRVTSINHLGDWGKQYGMLAVAFAHFGKKVTDPLTMRDLVDLYVRINQEVEKHPELEDQAKEAFRKLESGDPHVTEIWKKCVTLSIQEFERQYKDLGVHFDHIWGESFYKDQLTPLVESLKKSGLLVQSEGAWVVPVTDEDGKEMPPCILLKQDGATIYATRDVAAAQYRYQQFQFDRMTYIVGGEQKLHFKQLFAVLKKMNLPWASKCEHVPTGLYRFKDAKMSTRKGNFVTLEEVLEQAAVKAHELMKQRESRGEPLSDEEMTSISKAVGMGAVVFHDLHTDPAKDVEFDLDRIVTFEGETGPYLQYAHTRCLSILRKAGKTGIEFKSDRVKHLSHEAEIQLAKTLGRFPLHLERTLKFSKASQLAHYLIEVTKEFGTFYRECHVLSENMELTEARLMLVEATRVILAQGLKLLGIPLPERM